MELTADFDLDTIRTTLHLLGVTVWIGGQIVLVALVPLLRSLGGDAARLAAQRFSQVAWPFFGLIVITGIWNVAELDVTDASTGYNLVLGLKLVLVAATGLGAFVHANTESTVVRAVTGAGGMIAGLGAFVCGVMLVS